MQKIASLRAALVAAWPDADKDPDRLAIWVDKGRLVSRRTGALGFEYRYQVRLFFEAFSGAADAIMVPLLLWIREHQPELFLRFDQEDDAIVFSADILDDATTDVAIGFELVEAVAIVARGDGTGWDVTHLPEPSPDDLLLDGAGAVPVTEIWLGGERLLP